MCVYSCACQSNIEDCFVLNGLFVCFSEVLTLLLLLAVLAAMQIHTRPPRGSAAAEELLWAGRENEIKGWINQKNQHT